MANRVLGFRKSKPLLGPTRYWAIRAEDVTREHLVGGEEGAWHRQFAAKRPPLLLLERAILSTLDVEDERRGNLPLVRLRRMETIGWKRDVIWVAFETTVLRLMQWPRDDLAARQRELMTWARQTGLFKGMDAWIDWPLVTATHYHVVRALLWRVTAAAMLLPGSYDAQLYVDTHLELLVRIVQRGGTPYCPDEEYWFAAEQGIMPLAEFYPVPHRVLCAEEMPDLTPLLMDVDLFEDSDKKTEEAMSLREQVVHVFLSKLMNQICHKRHEAGTLVGYMKKRPEIEQMARLALECSLLGNFPAGVDVRLGLAARVKLVYSMAALTHERLAEWLLAHPLTTMFAIREWFLYAPSFIVLPPSSQLFPPDIPARRAWSWIACLDSRRNGAILSSCRAKP
jgi:hypothetical protein